MRHLDLFSGIGGFALAARIVGGIETVQFVEIDNYCQKLLAKNFPGVPIHGDITTFTTEPGAYDIITGGFPCQDISSANPNGRGLEGKRSGLFFELMRIVCECRPRYIVLENVSVLLSKHNGRDMGTVLWMLSESGYDAEWQTISAASVGAPHLRERIFIVAYPSSKPARMEKPYSGRQERDGSQRMEREMVRQGNGQSDAERIGSCRPLAPHPNGTRFQELLIAPESARPGLYTGTPDTGRSFWETESSVRRVANGIPHRLDRIRGLGNAVVPQVAAIALQKVLELDKR